MRSNLFMIRWDAQDGSSRAFPEDVEQLICAVVLQDGLERTPMMNEGRIFRKKEHGSGRINTSGEGKAHPGPWFPLRSPAIQDVLVPRREERIGGQPQQILGWGMRHHLLRQRPSNNAASVCKPDVVPFLGPYPSELWVLGQHAVGLPSPCHA